MPTDIRPHLVAVDRDSLMAMTPVTIMKALTGFSIELTTKNLIVLKAEGRPDPAQMTLAGLDVAYGPVLANRYHSTLEFLQAAARAITLRPTTVPGRIQDRLVAASLVILLTPSIRGWLAANDPQAFRGLELAVRATGLDPETLSLLEARQ